MKVNVVVAFGIGGKRSRRRAHKNIDFGRKGCVGGVGVRVDVRVHAVWQRKGVDVMTRRREIDDDDGEGSEKMNVVDYSNGAVRMRRRKIDDVKNDQGREKVNDVGGRVCECPRRYWRYSCAVHVRMRRRKIN